jgi:hypothetical protein
MWSWPVWKFPFAVFGVLCWAVLTWSNVMTVEAMSGSDLWGTRILMALMGALDLVGLFIAPALAWMLRRRSALGALGCVLIGGVCLLAEGAGMHRYLTAMTASIEAPSKDAEKVRADAQGDIEREERNRDRIREDRRKAELKGRDSSELARSERESTASIERLRRDMPKADAGRVVARFAGYELYASILLVALSQVAFFVVQARGVEAIGRPETVTLDPQTMELARVFMSLSGNPVVVRPDASRTQPDACLLQSPEPTPDPTQKRKRVGRKKPTQPKKAMPGLRLVKSGDSPVALWVKACLSPLEGSAVTPSGAYAAYTASDSEPYTRDAFYKALKGVMAALGVAPKRTSAGVVYPGWRLKNDAIASDAAE